ncbi:MAG: DUF4434 domain-containing protein [Yaniella sp.]|uniref:DUF4434 domain-containing protein n=1 Tax=Yaniella sp. TaxID=2773929 RepID=UPI003F9CFD94
MSKARSSEHTPTSNRKQVLLGILAVVLLGAVVLFVIVANNEPAKQDAVPAPAPAEPEPVCRAEGQFVAGFMSPQANDADTRALLERMDTDAITFGGRIVPATEKDYPETVVEAVRDQDIYKYSVTMNWHGLELDSADNIVVVGDTEYGLIQAGDDSVVITESVNGGDPFRSLTRVSEQRGNNAFIGLPVPQMRTSGDTWLPDNSYADVMDGFAKKFVEAYHQRGADGYYLAMEMPLTDTSHWDPVTDYYSRQTQIINSVSEGAAVLISPYLEGRKDSQTISPETAAQGYRKLLDLNNGTRILVSPQDGLGVHTTALEADESEEHQFTAEEYFEALQVVDPERLYATVEAMRPGGGNSESRAPTSRERVEQQLDATDPYVNGAIGFQWAEPNSMVHIPHIGDGACAAGPGQLY